MTVTPNHQFRAFHKSCRNHPEAPNHILFLLRLPVVCQAGGVPSIVVASYSMSMVRAPVLRLPTLLERAGILL